MPKGKMIQPNKAEIKRNLINCLETVIGSYIEIYGFKDFKENVLESYFDKKSELWTIGKSEIC